MYKIYIKVIYVEVPETCAPKEKKNLKCMQFLGYHGLKLELFTQIINNSELFMWFYLSS